MNEVLTTSFSPSVRRTCTLCCVVAIVCLTLALLLPTHPESSLSHWTDAICTVDEVIVNPLVPECVGYSVTVDPGERVNTTEISRVWAVDRPDPCSGPNATDFGNSTVPCLIPESLLFYASDFRCNLTHSDPIVDAEMNVRTATRLLARDCTNEHSVILGPDRKETAVEILETAQAETSYYLREYFLILAFIVASSVLTFWLLHVCYAVIEVSGKHPTGDVQILLDGDDEMSNGSKHTD